ASEAGVERLVTVGTAPEDWAQYAELATEHPQIDFTVGLHPCSVEAGWETSVAQIDAFWVGATKPVALGEIGLDRFHLPKIETEAHAVFASQVAAFEAQLELAKRLECPVVIHSRGAFAECVEVIDRSG